MKVEGLEDRMNSGTATTSHVSALERLRRALPTPARKAAGYVLRFGRGTARSCRAAAVQSWTSARRILNETRKNALPKKLFRSHQAILDPVQSKIVSDLRERGISFVHFDDLVGDGQLWQALLSMADEFANGEAVVNGIRRYNSLAPDADPQGKEYLVRHLPENPTVDVTHPLMRFALHDRILAVANSYLQLWATLHYVDSWYTIPGGENRRQAASQLWHRDYEDRHLVKVWLYYTDVDAGAGPLQYIPGSRFSRGRYRNLWADRFYPPIGAIDTQIPESERVTCLGPRGTIVFCDTTGFHRGGFATHNARLFSTWTYVTRAAVAAPRFQIAGLPSHPPLPEQASFALTW